MCFEAEFAYQNVLSHSKRGVDNMPLYDDSFRQLIANAIVAGASTSDIVEQLRVSRMTVYNYRRNIDLFGVHNPPPTSVPHRRRKIHVAAREGLADMIAANQTMMLDEVQDWLVEEWDIDVSLSTIQRCLKQMKISRKKTERVNPERDPELRALWLFKVATRYTASQLVVVDESAANERTKDRRWGWSPKGLACRVDQSATRSSRWSILPAIGINGYLEYEIYHGSFNSERFENFVKRLLTKMNRFPLPRSVLVMDNVATHHSPLVKQLCEEAGVILEYLPPYSPDLSPIEESFSVLKAWMRRNRVLAQPLGSMFDMFFHVAVASCDFKSTARNLFRACGIEVSDEEDDVDYDTLEVEPRIVS